MWNKLRRSKLSYIIISILGAIVFWLYVDIAQPSEAVVPIRGIPISFVGTEALDNRGLLVLGESPTVDIRVSGPRSVITRLNQSNITVTAAVGDLTEAGVYSVELTISLPSSITSSTSQAVRITSRSISAVDVTVVQMVSKTVEIRPTFTGTVAQNRFYDEDSFVLQQRELEIRGEQGVVDTVSYAKVVLSERNLSSTWSGWLDVTLCDKEGSAVDTENLTLEMDSVFTSFYVDCQKELPLRVTLLSGGGATEADAVCLVTPETVTVTGQEIQLSALDEIVLGTVELGKIITSGSYDYSIDLPNGVSLRDGQPNSAHVEVSIQGLETRRYTAGNIQLLNVPEGYRCQAQSIEVRVRGRSEAFALLMSDDIQVKVDLQDVELSDGAGVTVPATVEIEGLSELGALGSYSVEVTATAVESAETN